MNIKKVALIAGLCLITSIPTQIASAGTKARSSSSSGTYKSSSSVSKSSSSKASTKQIKLSTIKKSTNTKSTEANPNIKVTPKPKATMVQNTTYNTYNVKNVNTNFNRPTYRTYFTPSYYNPHYGNSFWSRYWIYQSVSQHSMHPQNNAVMGSNYTYSRGYDFFSVVIILLVGFAIYRAIKKRRRY